MDSFYSNTYERHKQKQQALKRNLKHFWHLEIPQGKSARLCLQINHFCNNLRKKVGNKCIPRLTKAPFRDKMQFNQTPILNIFPEALFLSINMFPKIHFGVKQTFFPACLDVFLSFTSRSGNYFISCNLEMFRNSFIFMEISFSLI